MNWVARFCLLFLPPASPGHRTCQGQEVMELTVELVQRCRLGGVAVRGLRNHGGIFVPQCVWLS